ncbi:MAG: hypothetical protein NTY07_16440 [Bacteroidia bacterium]|nr:hypothetical protein [Bacteroidia bacterium]
MKIKSSVLHLAATFSLFFYAASLSGQPDTVKAVSITANVDLVSRYIWRGIEIGHAPSIQPGLSATWKDFTLGAWGAYKLNGEGIQETDFYLSKTYKFVTVAFWDYWIFNDTTSFDFTDYREKTTGHQLEAQVFFSGGKTLPFNFLTSYFFYGADVSKSIYLELQYVHKCGPADLVLFAGYQAKGTYYAPQASFVNFGGTVKKTISITDRFSLPVSISLIVNPYERSSYLVAGITL